MCNNRKWFTRACALPHGQVSEGLDVLDNINEAFVDDNGRPLQNIRCGPGTKPPLGSGTATFNL